MPVFTLTLSAAALNELTECFGNGYLTEVQIGVGPGPTFTPIMGPNPETKVQFARKNLIRLLKQSISNHRERVAASTVDVSAIDIT